MKNYCLLFVLLFVFITGCGESIYSVAADTSTKEAIEDKLDFDLIDGNPQSVVDYYDSKISAGEYLNDDEMFKYISAVLMSSGFDIIRGMDSVAVSGGSDIYKMTADLLGIRDIDGNKGKMLQSYYDRAVSYCYERKEELKKDGLTLSKDITTMCGLTGMMASVVNMSVMLLNTSGGGAEVLELSEDGVNKFATSITDGAAAAQGLGGYLIDKDDFTEQLNNSLTLGEDGANAIGELIGSNDIGSALGDLASNLRDSNNLITKDSLLKYLGDQLGIPISPIP